MRDRLDQLLSEMEEEIGKQTYLDAEHRQHLRKLANHIEERINDDGNSSTDVEDHERSLNESVLLLEEEFPKLAAIVREIQQILVNIGV